MMYENIENNLENSDIEGHFIHFGSGDNIIICGSDIGKFQKFRNFFTIIYSNCSHQMYFVVGVTTNTMYKAIFFFTTQSMLFC